MQHTQPLCMQRVHHLLGATSRHASAVAASTVLCVRCRSAVCAGCVTLTVGSMVSPPSPASLAAWCGGFDPSSVRFLAFCLSISLGLLATLVCACAFMQQPVYDPETQQQSGYRCGGVESAECVLLLCECVCSCPASLAPAASRAVSCPRPCQNPVQVSLVGWS